MGILQIAHADNTYIDMMSCGAPLPPVSPRSMKHQPPGIPHHLLVPWVTPFVNLQAEAYPAMNPVRPLLPPDFLVSYADTVPGLRRFDCNGQLTTSCKSVISTLASPMLAPQIAVQLGNLQLRLPQMLHNLLSVLPQLVGVLP